MVPPWSCEDHPNELNLFSTLDTARASQIRIFIRPFIAYYTTVARPNNFTLIPRIWRKFQQFHDNSKTIRNDRDRYDRQGASVHCWIHLYLCRSVISSVSVTLDHWAWIYKVCNTKLVKVFSQRFLNEKLSYQNTSHYFTT